MVKISIEVQLLIDKHIPKSEIEALIFSMGFKKREDKGGYFWLGDKYKSIRGCWFGFGYDDSIYVDGEEKNYKTICETTTFSGRTYSDYQKQVDIIKLLEDSFGGEVYTEGDSGYVPNIIPNLDETEIACGLAYSNFKTNLTMTERLIEDVDIVKVKRDIERGFPLTDVSTLRNNTLIPFLVAIMETFFKTFIYRYLETNEEAQNLIFKKKDKIPYSVVKKLLSNEITISDIEIEEYSFQNLKSANNAFDKFLKLDLFKDFLSVKLEFEGEDRELVSILSELIEKRHKMIHEAELTQILNKEKVEGYHLALKILGENFVKVLEEKRRMRIDLFKLL